MSSIYGRSYDIFQLSQKMIMCNPEINFDFAKTSWRNVLGVEDDIKIKLSDDICEKLENIPIVVKRNPFRRRAVMNSGNGYDKGASITFPSLDAIGEYRNYYAHFLGRLLYRYKPYNDEFHYIIPFIFEYFSYTDKDNPREEFEKRNIGKQKVLARQFINYFNYYNNRDDYDIRDYESIILSAMGHFSSLDAALQLTDIIEKDEDKGLRIIDDILHEKKKSFEILEDEDITTYGYKRLRKSIEKYER